LRVRAAWGRLLRCRSSPMTRRIASSRRLAYGPTASRTRPLIFLGQAPSARVDGTGVRRGTFATDGNRQGAARGRWTDAPVARGRTGARGGRGSDRARTSAAGRGAGRGASGRRGPGRDGAG